MHITKNEVDYSEYDLGFVTSTNGRRQSLNLLLPSKLCHDLNELNKQAARDKRQADAMQSEQQVISRNVAVDGKNILEDDNEDEINDDPKAEAAKVLSQAQMAIENHDRLKLHLVHEPHALVKLLERSRYATNEELQSRDLKVYKQMRRLGPLRKVCNPAFNDDFESRFQCLS